MLAIPGRGKVLWVWVEKIPAVDRVFEREQAFSLSATRPPPPTVFPVSSWQKCAGSRVGPVVNMKCRVETEWTPDWGFFTLKGEGGGAWSTSENVYNTPWD